MRMILPRGTGYLTDAGMCGDYRSVIGMQKAEPMRRFVTGMPKGRFVPAQGPATLSGVADRDRRRDRPRAGDPSGAGRRPFWRAPRRHERPACGPARAFCRAGGLRCGLGS
jgi:hypothetical protein